MSTIDIAEALNAVEKDNNGKSPGHEEAPMTLGQQLAQQQTRSKAEQIAEQERIARQADAEKQRKYNDMQRYFQGVQEKLVEQIVAGKTEPRVSTQKDREIRWLFHESTTNRTFIGTETPGFCHEESPYYPLWLDFQAWAKENDLVLTTHFEHDGYGMESWYSFRVKPQKNL